jgi:hypothetical protein
MSGLLMIMASGGRASKAFTPANPHVPMPSKRHLEAIRAISGAPIRAGKN